MTVDDNQMTEYYRRARSDTLALKTYVANLADNFDDHGLTDLVTFLTSLRSKVDYILEQLHYESGWHMAKLDVEVSKLFTPPKSRWYGNPKDGPA